MYSAASTPMAAPAGGSPMVADLLALAVALVALPTRESRAEGMQKTKHRAVIVTGYPTFQKLVGPEADLHPNRTGIAAIYLGNILSIRFSELRRLSGKRSPFRRGVPIVIMTDGRPKTTSHMMLLVDLEGSNLIARWWHFTGYQPHVCIPSEVLEDYAIEGPIRGMVRNADGDLCLRR